MPSRIGSLGFVHYAWSARPSGRALARALRDAGYQGPHVNFGIANTSTGWHRFQGPLINNPRFVWPAANKRIALGTMRHAGVPIPEMYQDHDNPDMRFPVIGRTDHHRAGSGWWWCNNYEDTQQSHREGATHWLRYIPNTREFRVHIAFGQSIKLTEKLRQCPPDGCEGGSCSDCDEHPYPAGPRSHALGWHHMVPRPNAHRATLRALAKQAVATFNLDFAAVDILSTPTQHYVLECNTAPNLTAHTDTCSRYANAIHNHNQEA